MYFHNPVYSVIGDLEAADIKISGPAREHIMHAVAYRIQTLSVVAVLLLALSGYPSHAQNVDTTRGVTWYCWLGQDAHYSINCLDVGADDTIDSGAPAIFDTERPHHDLLVRIPGLAWLARMDSPAHGIRLVLIPLYNYPFSMERVSLLARSVLCGRDPLCTVRFEAGAP